MSADVPLELEMIDEPADRHQIDGEFVLEVEDLAVSFPSEDGVVRAVRGVSYGVRANEVLGIVGESGSGKSVSMLAVMGLLPRNAQIQGSIRFRGGEMLTMNERALRSIRGARVAMIFQDPMTSMNPVLSVGYQLVEAVLAHQDVTKDQAKDRAVELLTLVGIPNADARVNSYPHEFSGGMRQRAMIAMAMANDPDVLIADEPTTALDVTIQAQVLEVLLEIQEVTGTAIVLITHDLGVVARVAHRVVVMYAGEAVETGTVDDLFEQPTHPYTLGLLRSLPRVDGERELLRPIPGSPPSLIHPPSGCAFHPRCELAQPRCRTEATALHAVAGSAQLSACHFADDLVRGEVGS